MLVVMKLVVQLKLTPTPGQASVLAATLHALNEQANRASEIAFSEKAFRNYTLRKHTYAQIRAAGIGSQAAQHVIKKVADAYTTLKANLDNGNNGKPGSKLRRKAESKPIAFRPDAAHPYDQRNLSFVLDAQTISLWTLQGRLKDVPFACSPDTLKALGEYKRGESDLLCRDGMWLLAVTLDARGRAVRTGRFHRRGPGHRQHRHLLHRVQGCRAQPQPVPQAASGSAGQAPEEAHQVRQAPLEGTSPQGSAAREEFQPHHRQDDRGRG